MTFRAPVADLAFALKAAGHDALLGEAYPDLDAETVQAVLEAAGLFATDVLAPLNRAGDKHGARHEGRSVKAAPGFADAYRAFAEQGWNSLSAAPEHGGQGLSKAMELAVFEMVHAANMAFGLCPMLTQAAIEALDLHGTERHKQLILPRLISGEWTGTMNLTEPQAGTDLAALTTRAEPDGEGGWSVTTRDEATASEQTEQFAGVIIANGILSEPSIPEFTGEFTGEYMHTAEYRRPEIFRDKRILIIGCGNSGCDIAVDAVGQARSVDMSLRSGHWFFPKYILGRPSDTLNEGRPLPAPIKQRIDSRLIRLVTGNPARLGFPEPEGRIYETHPVMNTLVLYHAGHGDIGIKGDVRRFDDSTVSFADGSSSEYDMVMLATGYRLHYPFIDPEHLNWDLDAGAAGPDLYLNIFTPRHRNLFVLGMVEATGLGWQGRFNQSDLVAEFIQASTERPDRADRMWRLVNGPEPDLFAGYRYRMLDRLPYYVNKDAYRDQIARHLDLFRVEVPA